MVASQSPVPDPHLYTQLERLPEHQVGEIIGGELIVSPRPGAPHTLATSTLGGELSGPFQRGRGGPGGWWILDEPELHLSSEVLVLDLAGWRRERMPQVPTTAGFTSAPDWICEVLSAQTAALDRVQKLPRYAAMGVGYAWLVDPTQQTLEVFRRADALWVMVQAYRGAAKVRAEPFEVVEIELADLWIPPSPANEPPRQE